MKFVNVRDIRNRPGGVWSQLQKDDLILTSRGKPMALVVRLEEGDLEQTLRALRAARAQLALSEIRAHAAATGKDQLSGRQIDAVIRRARAARRRP